MTFHKKYCTKTSKLVKKNTLEKNVILFVSFLTYYSIE